RWWSAMTNHRRTSRSRRGFAIAIVLWAVAMAALALAAVQMSAARQSTAGREALARVRAQWAARAGVETVVATLQAEQKQASPLGAASFMANLAADSEGDLTGGITFKVIHQDIQGEAPGPADAHAKININRMTQADLMLLADMTEDVAAAILDWIDADEDVRDGGAELESYGGLLSSYKPRNGPIRDMRELELIRGVLPEFVRGEDWNLNGVLDPNENDGDLSWPPDNADGVLNAGWSQYVTAASIDGGLSPIGEPKVDLTTADASAVSQAVGCDDTQAGVITTWAQANTTGSLTTFLITPLPTLQQQQQQQGGGGAVRQRAQPLTDQQLGDLLDRCTVGDPTILTPGKLNLNTTDDQTLDYLASVTPDMRDALLAVRDQFSGEIESFAQLKGAQGINTQTLAALYEVFTVRSNVFTMTVRGKDEKTGIEVEIFAVVDRSADPVVIRSIVVR
ncbi:MAG: type II secretion system protein GspK, partial [Phycisphaerales bacterium]|nr:type II secretion system protein GspK [Phycisphaerales bacterium]